MAYSYSTPFLSPQTFVTDTDGFAPPPAGGTMGSRYNFFTFSDATKTLFSLPAGAVIVEWLVNVTQAFNSAGGTNNLLLGDGTTNNRYANNMSVASAGQIQTGFVTTEFFNTPYKAPVTVVSTYSQSGTATQGTAWVSVQYILGSY